MRACGNWRDRGPNAGPTLGSRASLVPNDASPDLVAKFILVRYALSRIGLRGVALQSQIRTAVKLFSAEELLGFNPVIEPPANDLPYQCDCGLKNQRGRTFCKQCRRRLEIKSRYRVWMGALAGTYVSGRCGILFGLAIRTFLSGYL